MVACLNYTLLTTMLLFGSPVMALDAHARRRRIAHADSPRVSDVLTNISNLPHPSEQL